MGRSWTTVRRSAAVAAVVAAVAAAWLAICAPAAWAHADLVSSDPAATASVAQSPPQVVLTFSEAVDPRLSLVQIVDAAGASVPGASSTEAVPGQPKGLQVTLAQSLPRGTYSVNWRAVSADDGHVTGGVFVFGVGVVPAPGSVVRVTLLHSSGWLSAVSSAGRWLLYLGLALLVGAASTGLAALSGRLPPGGVLLLRFAALSAAVGLCAMTVAERVMVGAPTLLPLFQTPEGARLLALGGALGFCAAAGAVFDLYPRRSTLAMVGVTGAVAMLVHAWAGHADAVPSFRLLNLTAQWVHMMAVGVWIGGLVWLLLALRRDPSRPGRRRAPILRCGRDRPRGGRRHRRVARRERTGVAWRPRTHGLRQDFADQGRAGSRDRLSGGREPLSVGAGGRRG